MRDKLLQRIRRVGETFRMESSGNSIQQKQNIDCTHLPVFVVDCISPILLGPSAQAAVASAAITRW